MSAVKILHFADAHIDMANYGRHDPASGLPLRVLDFLKALDTIVDCAIGEKVDLVLFAGDAYKDRSPSPTFQREWGRRIVRIAQAGIPVLLLAGNHDLSPSLGRASAMHEFETLQVPLVRVLSRPAFLRPPELNGLPLQVLALPWVSRSSLLAALEMSGSRPGEVYEAIEARLEELVAQWLAEANPDLPVVLTAHASVQGAKYGAERSVMLGGDLVLPGSLVRRAELDYVALGHIHKPQNLNPEGYPPAIYPGSIERVDFGEAADEKFFVIAHVERNNTRFEWRPLPGRRFIDRFVSITSPDEVFQKLTAALPPQAEMEDAIVRLTIEYPRQWDALLDEAALRQHTARAFEFHLVRRPQMEARLRLPNDQSLSSIDPLELLKRYWDVVKTDPPEIEALQKLAAEIIQDAQYSEPGLENE